MNVLCRREAVRLAVAATLVGVGATIGAAQAPPGPGRGTPPRAAQAVAPIDVTGYWVSDRKSVV